MQKLLWAIACMLSVGIGYSQECVNLATTGNPDAIQLNNHPNPVSFKAMLGINAGREWDQLYINQNIEADVDFTEVISFPRIFHEMQRDYATSPGTPHDPNVTFTPAHHPEGPILNAQVGNYAQYFGMNDNYQSYRLWYNHFKATFGPDFNGFMLSLTAAPFAQRSFPVGWFTNEEWGGGPDPFSPNTEQIRTNAKNYIQALAKTYCPKPGDTNCPGTQVDDCPCMVGVLEIGNEPWGYVNTQTYNSIVTGIFEGLDAYYGAGQTPFDVLPAAFQAYRPQLPNNAPTPPSGGLKHTFRDDMNEQVSCQWADRFTGVNVHPYSFEHEGFALTAYPEMEGEIGIDDGSECQQVKNAIKWCDRNMPGTKLFITEYGWDSRVVGPQAQADYLIRSTLMFARMGAYRTVIYEGLDSDDSVTGTPNKMGLFESCGLWETGDYNRIPQADGAKIAYRALKKFRALLGDRIFLQAISEQDKGAYAYVLGDQSGKATHLVAWQAAESGTAASEFTFGFPEQLTIATNSRCKYLNDDLSLDGTGQSFELPIVNENNGLITINLTTTPVLIPIHNPTACKYLPDGSTDCGSISTPCDFDDQPPVLSNCPEDIYVETPDSETPVFWETPTVMDNCSESIELWASHQSGDLFPAGITTVMFEAIDDAILSNTCSFEVHISMPQETLELQMPENIHLIANLDGVALVDWEEPIAISSCSINSEETSACNNTSFNGYTYLGNQADKHYYVSKFIQNWRQAKASCDEIGTELVTIKSETENNWLSQVLRENQIYIAFIGLSDDQQDGVFEWINGDPVNYTNWESEPTGGNGQADFAYLGAWTNNPWYTTNEWVYKPFVCQWTCNSTTQAPVVWRADSGPAKQSFWPIGEYTVEYVATDVCGQSTNASFSVLIEQAEVSECEPRNIEGYIQIGEIDEKQYLLSQRPRNWDDAQSACLGQGGTLVRINSTQENTLLQDGLNEHGIATAFIGLSDQVSDGQFQWTDGSIPSYENWGQSPSANGIADYVYLGSWTNGPWYTAHEGVYKPYICEINCLPNSPANTLIKPATAQALAYPNPLHTTLEVSQPQIGFQKLILLDVNGRKLWNENYPETRYHTALDLSGFPNGFYTLVVAGEELGVQKLPIVKLAP